MNAGANSTTGLVADRQSVSGSPNGNYKYDACRAPWRICLDYLWNINEKAMEWCIKVSNFADKFGIKNIQEGFTLSGLSLGGSHNMCYTGGFAIAAMANSLEMAAQESSLLFSCTITRLLRKGILDIIQAPHGSLLW